METKGSVTCTPCFTGVQHGVTHECARCAGTAGCARAICRGCITNESRSVRMAFRQIGYDDGWTVCEPSTIPVSISDVNTPSFVS